VTVSGSRATSTEFADALAQVAGGGTALDPEVVGQLSRSSRHSRGVAALTPRERDVMALMAEGRSNAGIAGAPLSVSARVAESTWPASSTSWHCLRGRQPPGTRVLRYLRADPPQSPSRRPPRSRQSCPGSARRAAPPHTRTPRNATRPARTPGRSARTPAAWETADADEISDLFTPDASYRSSVFREPYPGSDAIRQYRQRGPGSQRDVVVRTGRPVHALAHAGSQQVRGIPRSPGKHQAAAQQA